MRIACLHTATSNAAIFEDVGKELGFDAGTLRHTVRADLLSDAEQARGLTREIEDRTVRELLALCEGADAVLLACSTLGPAVEALVGRAPVPTLRVDAALAAAAVRNGNRVVALCAVETTLRPTRALFETAARATGAQVEVRLVPDAWAAFKAGERDRYLILVAAAADAATRSGAGQVALAQASMAGAARFCQVPPPLTSPAAGLAAACAAASNASR